MTRFRNRKFDSDWIYKLESFDHWISYWYQLKLMDGHVKEGDTLVELCIGTGFLANYLKSKGVKILTLDIDENKKPDIVIDAVDFHPDIPFDYFCAFEVFEHMEFNEMIQVIDNIKKYVSEGIFISLPMFKKTPIHFDVWIKSFHKVIYLPFPKRRITDKHHYWELGFNNYTVKRLISEYTQRGFMLRKTFEYLRWRFFHFEKRN